MTVDSTSYSTSHKASCACGALSITVEGAPLVSSMCFCTDCRKRTASAYGMTSFYPKDRLVRTEGENKTFRRIGDSGNPLDFHFCPTCGVSVWWEMEAKPEYVGIGTGLFDNDFAYPPERAVYCQSKPGFVTLPEDLTMYQQGT